MQRDQSSIELVEVKIVNALISIVVPIYNVEKWLARCIENIVLGQSFQRFELILVNDGSPDRCGEICENYAKKDNRIKIIYKENGGVSSARNAGIVAANGKYIVFIDPDDLIREDYLSRLYQVAEEHECDAVVSGYQTVPNNQMVTPGFTLKKVMNGKNFILSSVNVHSKNDLCFAWRYIYKLCLIKEKNLRFNEQVFIGEDVIFNLEFLLASERVNAIPDNLYFYTINNPDSLMRSKYKPKLENSLSVQYKVRKDLSIKYGLFNYKYYKQDMAYYYINRILRLLINNLKAAGGIEEANHSFRRLINSEMISNSLEEIGWLYKCENIKEYIYYLALKLKVYPLLSNEFKRDNI